MLKLSELYEVRKVELNDNTYYNYVVPFVLSSGDKFMLDFSSVAKGAMRKDGRDHRGSVGPNLAIEINRAIEYATYVETHAIVRNASRFSSKRGYVVKADPLA